MATEAPGQESLRSARIQDLLFDVIPSVTPEQIEVFCAKLSPKKRELFLGQNENEQLVIVALDLLSSADREKLKEQPDESEYMVGVHDIMRTFHMYLLLVIH